MEQEKSLETVMLIAKQAEDPQSGLQELVQYLDPDSKALAGLAKMKIDQDIAIVRSQLKAIVDSEPPPSTLDAVFFGLFDMEDDDGEEAIGYYVSGVEGFMPDDLESLEDPTWFPEERYLTSSALSTLKKAELSAADDGLEDLGASIAYAGRLGLAALISRFASDGLFPGLRRVVGFESGDFVLIDDE